MKGNKLGKKEQREQKNGEQITILTNNKKDKNEMTEHQKYNLMTGITSQNHHNIPGTKYLNKVTRQQTK